MNRLIGDTSAYAPLIAVFLALLSAGTAFAIDMEPVVTIAASPIPAETFSEVTALAVDSGDSAGISSIVIFEDGLPIETFACAGSPSCAHSKGVSHSIAGTHSYFAQATDITGHTIASSSINVSFDGDNVPPVLDTIGNRSVPAGNLLSFSVSGSDANPNDAVNFSASGLPAGATFSGGTFSWAPTIGQQGNYSVQFTAMDNHGATDNETINIEVTFVDLAPPEFAGGAGTGWSGNLTAGTGDSVTVFANATDNVDVTSATITFGGGFSGSFAMAEGPDDYFNYSLAVPCCSLDSITYTITVSDAAGNSNTTQLSAISPFDNDAPSAVINNGSFAGFSGVPIVFNASQSSDNIGISSYFWDFGDGTNSSSAQVSKAYTSNGTFTATLTVWDAAGNFAAASANVSVSVDVEGPSVSGLSFTNPLTEGNDQVITATVTDNSGALGGVVVSLNGSNYTMAGAGSTFTATIPAANLPAGNYNFTIIAADFVGNINDSVGGLFDVVPAPAPPPSPGHGGGGGGGRGGGGRPPDTNSSTFCWLKLGAGSYSALIPEWSSLPVTKLAFKVSDNQGSRCLRIELVDTKGMLLAERAYSIINITTDINASAIPGVELYYKVPRNWTSKVGEVPENIAMARFSEGWERLPTEITGEDANYTYHVSYAPGFSKFAIIAKPQEPEEAPPEAPPEAPEEQEQPEEKLPIKVEVPGQETRFPWLIAAAMAGIVFVTAGIAYYSRRPKAVTVSAEPGPVPAQIRGDGADVPKKADGPA